MSVEDDGRGIPWARTRWKRRLRSKWCSRDCTPAASSTRKAAARLRVLRRPARRGRVRDQRACQAHGSARDARRVVPIAFRGRRGRLEAQEVGKAGPREARHRVRAWPDPKYFDAPKVKRAELSAAAREGGAAAGPEGHAADREGGRKRTNDRSGSTAAGLREYLADARRLREPDLRERMSTAARRELRPGRRRGVGDRVGRGGRRGRVVREPHPDGRRGHARSGAAQRRVRIGEGILRAPRAPPRASSCSPRTCGSRCAIVLSTRCSIRSSRARPRSACRLARW